jgi:hypothetical protein
MTPRKPTSMMIGTAAMCSVLLLLAIPGVTFAADEEGADLAEMGKKLANPVADVWALFTEFDFTFSDGSASGGDDQFAFSTVFEPVMPIKITDSWKLITRPTIPVIWSAPVPSDNFDREIALGDMALPLVAAPNGGLHIGDGEIVGGVGPSFVFPTATSSNFGSRKYEVGVAGVAVYKTNQFTLGIFPQWWWSVGDKSGHSKPDTSHGEMIYFFYYNLPDAWQIGFSPTITIDAEAPSGDKWNVPIGITVAKTTRMGKMPVKFQLGMEYSVVSEDDYGKRALIKFNVIPVIPDLIKKPLF